MTFSFAISRLSGLSICILTVLAVAPATGAKPVLDILPGQTVAGVDDTEEKVGYKTPAGLRFPYASMYYVQPTVLAGDDVKIRYYVTDWAHSLARFNDDSRRFDVTVRMTRGDGKWLEKTAANVRTGDGEVVFSGVPLGEWDVSVVAFDRQAKLPSHTVWHEFRVVPRDFWDVSEKKTYRMTAEDLERYAIRNDGGHGRLVLIEVDSVDVERLNEKGRLLPTTVIGRKAVARYLQDHPHQDAERPGYAVYVPAKGGIPQLDAWESSTVVYDKAYDREGVARIAVATRKGLQRFLDDKASAGFRKVVLLPGVYRIDHGAPLQLPNRVAVDLNGATVKLDGFAGAKATMVRMSAVEDAVLENGTIEGDYYEHDYANSPGKSEWVMSFIMDSCCKNCEIRNVTVKDAAGYGGGNGWGDAGPGRDWYTFHEEGKNKWWAMPCFAKWFAGGLRRIDGTVDGAAPFQFTTDYLALGANVRFKWLEAIPWRGDRNFRSMQYVLAWYDTDKKFLSAEVGYRYRSMRIPEGAVYVRYSIEADSFEHAKSASCAFMIGRVKCPVNCSVRNCRFDRCRAVAWAMSHCRNFLFEGNEFTHSGEQLARCAFDSEDGDEHAYDVTFWRNDFHENPNNDLLVMRGMNFTIENNRCSIWLYPRCNSYCVRSNVCVVAGFNCREKNRTGYWRFADNVCQQLRIGGTDYVHTDWEIVVHDQTFDGLELGTNFVAFSGATGLFRNCTFRNIYNSVGNAENCTFENTRFFSGLHGQNGTWTNCRAKNGALAKCRSTGVFRNCSFENFRIIDSDKNTFIGCVDEKGPIPREGRAPVSGKQTGGRH